jgi:ubiquinone/menaquinone biosynthesis C-methylase UbiE
MMSRDIQSLVDDYYQHYYKRVHSNLEGNKRYSFHFKLESSYSKLDNFPIVLELGAGNLNHSKFVKHSFQIYLSTDIRAIEIESMLEIEPGLIPKERRFYKSKADATELAYATNSVNRLVTGCLLLHLDNPVSVLEEWLRVLKPGGVIDTVIPNDQSLLVKLYRSLYSRRKSKKLGFADFDLVNAFEHRSYYERVFLLVNASFPSQQFEFEHYPPIIGNIRALRAYSILRLQKV